MMHCLRLLCGAPCLLCVALSTLLLSAPLRAEVAAPIKVDTIWNIRFSSSPDLQSGNAGLADLHIPVMPGDTITVGIAPEPFQTAVPAEADEPIEAPEFVTQAPVRVIGKLRPAVVVVHGGGWLAGNKWTIGGYAQQLSELGICVLNINYRLAPQSKFPAQVDDVRDALLYLADHAEELSIDPTRIGLFGYSAGGHLSALVGVLEDESREVQATASNWPVTDLRWARLPRVAAVCAGGPPCDFQSLPLDNDALSYFLRGSRRDFPELYAAASPIAHVSSGDPPIQLIHGETDMIVPLVNSERFAAASTQAGVSVCMTVIAKQGHIVTLMHPETQSQVSKFFGEQFLSR